MIGGNGTQHNNLHFNGTTIKVRQNLPQEKTFFAAVYLRGRIYTFGGYDSYDKVQLDQCEYYDLKQDRWFNSPIQRPNGQVEGDHCGQEIVEIVPHRHGEAGPVGYFHIESRYRSFT